MSTGLTRQIDSTSSDATELLAEQLGQRLRGGEIIELISDLGGGKTTFVRGLAAGAGSPDSVASPTFTISKVYKTAKFEIHHFDFYRLQDAGLMQFELAETLHDPTTVTVIEWGDVVKHILPNDRLTITISRLSETDRTIELAYPASLDYLVEGL